MENNLEDTQTETSSTRTGGYCRRCNKNHWLPVGNSLQYCRELMDQFDKRGTVDLYSPEFKTDQSLELAYLFGPAKGKMFGVMECLRPDGTITVLRAFSGQYNGAWLVEGWAPPLFDVSDFILLTTDIEKQIKRLGREIDRCAPYTADWLALRKQRRRLSRSLMKEIHTLYSLTNFKGETVSLEEAYMGARGIPTGTGDCCAPKLLNLAVKNNLHPLGITEFYWGRENLSGNHNRGSLSSSCAEKCQPILGFMLCGLEGNHTKASR